MKPTPDPDAVVTFCVNVLPPNAYAAIVSCAEAGYGERRNLGAILATAIEYKADPRIVAAAFLFLPDCFEPETYRDVTDVAAQESVLLSADLRVFAAFALGRLAAAGVPVTDIGYVLR